MLKFVLFFFSMMCFGNDLSVIAVGKAQSEVVKLGIDVQYLDKTAKVGKEFKNVISNDFSFYKKYFLPISLSSKELGDFNNVNFSKAKSKGLSYLIQVSIFDSGVSAYDMTLFDIRTKEAILKKQGPIHSSSRKTIHSLTNAIYKKITGKESIFESQIVFVSDRESYGKRVIKELYIMDFDGANVKKLTSHRGIVVGPAINLDRTKILYSLISGGISKHKNVNLYLFDMVTKKSRLISAKKGINTGAVFAENGEDIYLTLGHTGDAEIYKMNLKTKALKRITRKYAPDVDPSVNKDGSLMVFLSGRTKAAHVHTLDPSGTEKNVKRISYVGKFNATPRFSPDGQKIVFSSWLDNRFDIFRVDSSGNNLFRLTKDFGSNEDPSYSNDGQFIAFSSQRVISRRKAVTNIYIMDDDGQIIGSVTKGFGNCITPRWTK